MLFNSHVFLFLFLPIVVLIYRLLLKRTSPAHAQLWVVLASITFYGYWNIIYVPLLLSLMAINYLFGDVLQKQKFQCINYKYLLAAAIVFNVSVLAYFKYTDFFIDTANTMLKTNFPLLNIILPLGISFFTFQKIAYLVDCYRRQVNDRNVLRFAFFVLFFPQLIAGPIVHYRYIFPQLREMTQGEVSPNKTAQGLFLIAVGLFKKVVIADTFAGWVNPVFSLASNATLWDSWTAVLAYTFQIYFDFSGYCDMAIGAALLFGLTLPMNFNHPYSSTSIGEFWRRWHITLGEFMREYIYIPLGGNKYGRNRMFCALFITMLIGGLWHGAGWTFVVWGVMHGTFLCIERLWHLCSTKRLNTHLARALTFFCVVMAWVPFRASSMHDAFSIWKAMFGLNGFVMPLPMANLFKTTSFDIRLLPGVDGYEILALLILILIVWFSSEYKNFKSGFVTSSNYLLATLFMGIVGIYYVGRPSTFLYFNF